MTKYIFVELESRESKKGRPPGRVMINVDHISDLHEEEIQIGVTGMDGMGNPTEERFEMRAGITLMGVCNVPLSHTYDQVKQLLENELRDIE